MFMPFAPPGLDVSSDPQTATASGARCRVALAAKLTIEEMSKVFSARFASMEDRIDSLLAKCSQDTEHRLSRLETLTVCNPLAK